MQSQCTCDSSAFPESAARSHTPEVSGRVVHAHTETISPDQGQIDRDYERAVATAVAAVEHLEQVNANQRGRSWALPVPEDAYANIPAWVNRLAWQRQLRTLLNSEVGQTACRTAGIDTEKCFAGAVAMAGAADSATGRNVTLSNKVIAERAGFDPDHGGEPMVRRVRAVLTSLQMAVEVVRGRWLSPAERRAARIHHGGYQRAAGSVWALSSPRQHADALPAPRCTTAARRPRKTAKRRMNPVAGRTPAPAHPGTGSYPHSSSSRPLPPFRGVSKKPSFGSNSPTRALRARGRFPDQPRPIHLQRAAAELEFHVPALAGGTGQDQARSHMGWLCDALEAADIDTQEWSGRQLVHRLNLHGVQTGWVWPQHLKRPAAFLTARLRQLNLPATPETSASAAAPRSRGAITVTGVGQPPAYQRESGGPGSTSEGRAAALKIFADQKAAKKALRGTTARQGTTKGNHR